MCKLLQARGLWFQLRGICSRRFRPRRPSWNELCPFLWDRWHPAGSFVQRRMPALPGRPAIPPRAQCVSLSGYSAEYRRKRRKMQEQTSNIFCRRLQCGPERTARDSGQREFSLAKRSDETLWRFAGPENTRGCMNLSFGAVRAIDAGIWVGALSATEAAKLPGAPLRVAGPHVVLVTNPAWNGRELQAPYLGVSVLALGAGDDAIYVRAGGGAATPPETPAAPQSAAPATGDDNVFIDALAQLGTDLERIGRALMARIRARYPGALAQTENFKKFVETPDNFWGVEIQPRVGAIKLIVRADEERMKASGLPYQSERPPAVGILSALFSILEIRLGRASGCPKCPSAAVVRNGKAGGLRRYKDGTCGVSVNA